MSNGQMGCRASPGQNKMALNVLKTHVRSETRVTGILNITVDSQFNVQRCSYVRFLSSWGEWWDNMNEKHRGDYH